MTTNIAAAKTEIRHANRHLGDPADYRDVGTKGTAIEDLALSLHHLLLAMAELTKAMQGIEARLNNAQIGE